jgi:hypothetical protein
MRKALGHCNKQTAATRQWALFDLKNFLFSFQALEPVIPGLSTG